MLKRILNKLKRIYVSLEKLPYINWFNPFCTVYLNFRCFPIKQAILFPIYVYGRPRLFSLYGTMECIGKCYSGMVRFNQTNVGAPNLSCTNTEIDHWGKIIFHGKCQIYTANKINTGINGIIELGDCTKIMSFCNITAYSKISIGEQSRIVHRCQVLDTNFHLIADFNNNRVKRVAHPIFIGDYCWICNSTTVTGGAIIPNKTIVASNSLVGKDYSNIPEESMIGGVPAKHIATGFRRVENRRLEADIYRYFRENPNAEFYPLQEGVDHNCCNA